MSTQPIDTPTPDERQPMTLPHLVEMKRAREPIVMVTAYDDRELETHSPIVVHVDDDNAIARIDSDPGVLLGSPLASEVPA